MIDLQEQAKGALIAWFARGPVHGPDLRARVRRDRGRVPADARRQLGDGRPNRRRLRRLDVAGQVHEHLVTADALDVVVEPHRPAIQPVTGLKQKAGQPR